ncbi:MAG: pyridoxal-phosphate dependent enzyme [Theionarchaea archaeon]|nr:pyridoxal-phosphate dependent enzyme [Theionarchaea archaeon]
MGHVLKQKCLNCGAEYAPDAWMVKGCDACRTDSFVSNLKVIYDIDAISNTIDKKTLEQRKERNLWRYKEFLPIQRQENMITLGEGSTPLIKCEHVGEYADVATVYVKNESVNPTWSFKDRLCCTVVCKARELGFDTVTISTSGNHGAATAAYASKAGLNCVIFTFEYTSAAMKTSMQIYNPMLVATPSAGWALAGDYVHILDNNKFLLVGSSPFGKDGYKTIAFEIIEQLDWNVPDWISQPTCYANGLQGVWHGFKDFKDVGFTDSLPRMVAAEKSGILADALREGKNYPRQIEYSKSIALSIAGFLSTFQGLNAVRESNGRAMATEDEELLEMQRTLGKDGVFAEASSAASLVAIKKLREEGALDRQDVAVGIITGAGLKDIDPPHRFLPPLPVINPTFEELKRALKEVYGYNLK